MKIYKTFLIKTKDGKQYSKEFEIEIPLKNGETIVAEVDSYNS